MPHSVYLGHKQTIHVSVDQKVIQAIDSEKGSLSRSQYVADLLWYAMLASEEEQARIASYNELKA